MKEKKTRKLTCVVTGKALIATKQYYNRKVAKIGEKSFEEVSDEAREKELHRTYVCKEAKNLLIKGYDVDKIREILNIDTSELKEVPGDVVTDILNNNKPRWKTININNIPISSIINPKTDPEVKKFIQYIIDSNDTK